MEFGLLIGDVPTSVTPAEHLDQLLRQVDAAQDNGFSLITMGQHYLYGDIRWLQPIPTLARLSARLDPHVRLGTTVLIAPLHHPVALAEDVATLDILTEGRLNVGLGLGYRVEEYRQFGIPYEERVRRFEEMVPLLRELWTSERVTFHGDTWQLDDAQTHLRPVQQPTPPIWIGANTRAGVRRSARLGDAWPIGPRMTLGDVHRALGWYYRERDELQLPRTPQPIRREIILGADETDARGRFQRLTAARFESYANRERAALPGGVMPGDESSTAYLGTPQEVCIALEHLARSVPLGPVILRAQWPGMDAGEIEGYLRELGRLVVAPLRHVPSLPPADFPVDGL
jgi:alkanesulfonate monooxygenase SsuD/methylene tetrahydromethanopterin reductase-like flavin-dependent oxidoreductase (luciferase family)